ncbi:leucine zipper domain-containing protein [Mesorhizobium sp. M0142]|uniref:leucine zipper domain-containing protein n=1 Tax=Mesorhizobium sp. M0142 TaxID=2956894 RepID=UPI003334BC47
MNIHKNFRLTPLRREEMARDVVEGRLSKADAARTCGATAKVVAPWVDRFRIEGSASMLDHSWQPKTSPRRTEAAVADAIVALRRRRLTGEHIAMQNGRVGSDGEPGAGTRRPVAAEYRAPAEPVRRLSARAFGTPHHRAISGRDQPPSRHRLVVPPCLHR